MVPADAPDADLHAPGFANFANGVLGIADEVKENLNQLIGVADNHGQIGLRLKIHVNIVAAKRMILQLKGALDKVVDVDGPFLPRGRPGKLQQVLTDARGGPPRTTWAFLRA